MSNDRLKFRAWDKWRKQMLRPNDGDFIGWHAMSNWRDCLEVMQWTGLYDSEGVEIYEMDYLSDCHFTWVVEKCLDGWWCKLISHNNDKINKTPVSYILDARLAAGMPVTVCGNAYDA